MNLPPLATHALCLLAGTLVFQPAGGPPEGDFIFLSWKGEAISPRPALHRRYKILASGKGDCLISPKGFPVWLSPQEKSYLILPKTNEGFALLRTLQHYRIKDLALKDIDNARPCSSGSVRYD